MAVIDKIRAHPAVKSVRNKIAAQDLILKAIDELADVLREKGEPSVADSVQAERDRLAKKWGVS